MGRSSFKCREEKYVLCSRRFAHGFYVLSDTAEFNYKCTDFYDPSSEAGIMWNDPVLNVKWPVPDGEKPVISEKDEKNPGFSEDIFLKFIDKI